ncbi:cytochrome b562 [bacterium]|jgi:soluble cytochrome b562|nr:cytochrome b562 [Planctomycetota bacterium]MDB4538593.1 cytochrome b562 [bacterium]
MIQRSKLTLLALPGLAVLALAIQNADHSSASPSDGAAIAVDDDGEGGPLHESMEVIQKGMKGIRKMLSKPEQKAAAVTLCQEMQAAALVGFQHPPKPQTELDADAQVDFSADFRKRMLTVCSTLVDLEAALAKGDADAAKTIYRTLGKQKKEGHDTYL